MSVDRPEANPARKFAAWLSVRQQVVGAVVVFLSLWALSIWHLGWQVVSGSPDIWQIVGYDQGGGLAALRIYVNDPWTLNPLMISSIGDGVAITLTDSNALVALIAKILRPLGFSVEWWQGMWVSLLPAANGTAGYVALRAFRPRALEVAIVGGVLIGLMPFMLFRVFHPALAFHAPIILGIAAVGVADRKAMSSRFLLWCTVLPVLAFLIHPYLGPMSALPVAAAVLTAWHRGRATGIHFALWAFGVVAGWLTLLALSDVHNRDVVPSLAGPIYTANPLNPVTPQFSDLWPGGQLFGPRTSWEGLAWVGMGSALVLCVAGILVGARNRHAGGVRRFTSWIDRWGPGVFVGTVAMLFAVSSRIEFAASTTVDLRDRPRIVWFIVCAVAFIAAPIAVAESGRQTRRLRVAVLAGFCTGWFWNSGRQGLSDVVNPVFDAFRATGRFIWVPTYFLVIGALVVVADGMAAVKARTGGQRSRVSRFMPALVLIVPLALQVADTRTLQDWGRAKIVDDSLERRDYMSSLTETVRTVISRSGSTRLQITPDLGCLRTAPEVEAYRDAVIAASLAGVGITGDYSARPLDTDCSMTAGIQPDAQLVVVGASGLTSFAGGNFWCDAHRLVGICRPASADAITAESG